MHNLGVEIEFTGVKRSVVVRALEFLFRSRAQEVKANTEDAYKYYRITDLYDKKWVVKRDRSIRPQKFANRNLFISDACYFEPVNLLDENYDYRVEVVSPVLNGDTLPLLFSVVDLIKGLGGLVNSSCGIHVHIDKMEGAELYSLYKRFITSQDEIISSFNVEEERLKKYCKLYSPAIVFPEPESTDDFLSWLFYNYGDSNIQEGVNGMKSLKYYALNFYSIYSHGTIEYRLFNSSLEKCDIAKIIKWVLDFSYPFEHDSKSKAVLEQILVSNIIS